MRHSAGRKASLINRWKPVFSSLQRSRAESQAWPKVMRSAIIYRSIKLARTYSQLSAQTWPSMTSRKMPLKSKFSRMIMYSQSASTKVRVVVNRQMSNKTSYRSRCRKSKVSWQLWWPNCVFPLATEASLRKSSLKASRRLWLKLAYQVRVFKRHNRPPSTSCRAQTTVPPLASTYHLSLRVSETKAARAFYHMTNSSH